MRRLYTIRKSCLCIDQTIWVLESDGHLIWTLVMDKPMTKGLIKTTHKWINIEVGGGTRVGMISRLYERKGYVH